MGNFFYFDDMQNSDVIEQSEILLYSTEENDVHISVAFYNETFWLTQKAMAELFAVDVTNINKHLKNIFESNELDETATIENFSIVQNEGNRTVRRTLAF